MQIVMYFSQALMPILGVAALVIIAVVLARGLTRIHTELSGIRSAIERGEPRA